ncbi:rhomboid family intramembrane serine protease [Hydrotalea sp.]|uniref:rhomboid family intramembrane serine protease n=1 Tax=Hydrotalea sp. TaxID=2881279 RepID=UPI003D1262F7
MTEFRPGRFQILPLVIKNLIIINGLVFLAQMTIGRQGFINMDDLFALHTFQSPLFRPWQLITHMFMHGSFEHIFFNMFALWMFGSVLENLWGPKRFLTFYIVCGLGAALSHLIVLYFQTQHLIEAFNSLDPATQQLYRNNFLAKLNEATIGASGAVFGCLAAFGYLFPNTRIYLYFFVPIKAKWFVIMYAAFELYLGIKNSAGDDVAHFAHLGGALVGIILVYFWNKNNRKTFY